MRKVKNRLRPNQKSRHAPHREIGVFSKNGTIRIVELHGTKGFREQNGEVWRKDFTAAMENNKPITLARGQQRKIKVMPVSVQSNAPKIRHNKTG